MKKRDCFVASLLAMTLVCGFLEAAEYASLFRGVIVQSASPGAKVVSVDQTSPAYESGLKPGDQIVRVGEEAIATLEDFAAASQKIKGKVSEIDVVVLRASDSVSLNLSLHSRAIERLWGERFVPDGKQAFADPLEGAKFWAMQARKHRLSGDDDRYMDSLWNLLHYEPNSVGTAFLIAAASTRKARKELRAGHRVPGMRALRTSIGIYRRAFAMDLTEEELNRVHEGLLDVQATVLQLAEGSGGS